MSALMPPRSDDTDRLTDEGQKSHLPPVDARAAALDRLNTARARHLDADRRGEWNAAARHRDDARRALADLLDLPDPAVDEVALKLERLAVAANLADEMARHYAALGDAETAAGWRRDEGTAEAEARRLKEVLADNLIRAIRYADEVAPDALAVAVGEARPVRELRERLEVVEKAIVLLADGRAVPA